MEIVGEDYGQGQQRRNGQQSQDRRVSHRPASVFQEKAGDGGGIGQLEVGLDLDPEDLGR